MKIATWNVNSIRVRLPHLLAWLAQQRPDIVALQETKVEDPQFPAAELEAAGYQVLYAGQKTYNGVALLSRSKGTEVVHHLPDLDDPQRRVLMASYDGLRVINVYVPNGETVGSDKYAYKLRWLDKLIASVASQQASYSHIVVLGDFNIAPEDQDVYDPQAWEGKVLFSDLEKDAFQRLLGTGLCDTLRLFDKEEAVFSWWDYRMAAFRRNMGLRIDHILASATMCETCSACDVDKVVRTWERPSDHAPVVAQFDI